VRFCAAAAGEDLSGQEFRLERRRAAGAHIGGADVEFDDMRAGLVI
jgi:hypothetical protein